MGDGMSVRGRSMQHGKPFAVDAMNVQPDTREGEAGHERRLGAHIVSYTDDLMICCKGSAEQALLAMRHTMARLKLTVNDEKIHVCRVPEQYFDFLGYQFARFYSLPTGRAYLGTRPSKKSVKRLIKSFHEQTAYRTGLLETEEQVECLNRKLQGWANYFKLRPVSKVYRLADQYSTNRLRRWLCHKHKVRSVGYSLYPNEYLYGTLGLVQLPTLTRNLPWATA
jgi:hypothetical protein